MRIHVVSLMDQIRTKFNEQANKKKKIKSNLEPDWSIKKGGEWIKHQTGSNFDFVFFI